MAASLHGSVLLRNANHNLYGIRVAAALPSSAASFPLVAVPRGLDPACSLLNRRVLGSLLVPEKRRPKKFVALAISREESKNSDFEVEKDNDHAAGGSQEAWKEALERLKAESLNVKSVSEEAYQVYSTKAIEMLMDTSENLKIQADKVQTDLSVLAQEISKEGQEYLSAAAKNYPDSVREILEVYASVEELSNISSVRDFYLGIPYGCFLAVGGFLHFMLTGSIPAIRFGFILGTAILALSVSSLRAWKNGNETPLLLVGQTAISAIIFFRQWMLCSQRGLFPNLLMLAISGAMMGFYAYRLAIDHFNKDDDLEQSSENQQP
ncbi:protein FATTY ACID EXPORT 3, chloroplastic-like [Zingiber officinale]|uniref:protein FATTY ACID EXPORT 3, chloroplastic-like n=1 Tax=Zingiber officinale TaxID=94328 RepID=UPI001C4D2928|nr:protein FATTY ACID EXPORT 3, chloroplastic-like [Zingiber officinale]